MRRVLAVLGTVTFGLACAHGVASALPSEASVDPVCETGVQSTVYDDEGVAHVACVMSEAPANAEGEPTTTVAAAVGTGSLPKTGSGTEAALLGFSLVSGGLVCRGVARRARKPKVFRARRLTP